MATRVYDPKQIVLSVAGLLISSGFSEDSMVKCARTAPSYEGVVGADGEYTRVRQYDDSALVTISLMQSSEGNDILSALHSADRAAPNGAGIGAFLLKDLNGNTLVQASKCWVKGSPEQEYGKKVNMRAWEIMLADAEIFVGGNTLA
jgi:hypothetical protein